MAAPSMVTGSDPTQLPIAFLVAPIAAAVLTAGVCGFPATVTATGRRDDRLTVGSERSFVGALSAEVNR